MYIRTKKRENGKFSMQIVENSRVNGSPRQRVVRHVGTVDSEGDLVELEKFAHYLKRQIEEELQPSLFDMNEIDKINGAKGSSSLNTKNSSRSNNTKINTKEEKSLNNRKPVGKNVLLENLIEEERKIVGFHDIYGSLFDEIGFKNIFNGFVRNKSAVNILYHFQP